MEFLVKQRGSITSKEEEATGDYVPRPQADKKTWHECSKNQNEEKRDKRDSPTLWGSHQIHVHTIAI